MARTFETHGGFLCIPPRAPRAVQRGSHCVASGQHMLSGPKAWEHHLRAGDYSAWFRNVIKDNDMAQEAAEIEADKSLGSDESRKRLRDIVSRRYTAPLKA